MAVGKSSTSKEILEFALRHMVAERDAIQARIDGVRRQLGGPGRGRSQAPATESAGSSRPTTRNLSAAARQRIADAQRRRWDKVRGAKAAVA